jgi:hypothetical protein
MAVPTKGELLDHLELLDSVLGEMATRWFDGISPEVRDQIAVRAYQPNLRMLIRARRRPLPRA